jgi:uncharacterized protein (TIGR02271 family)
MPRGDDSSPAPAKGVAVRFNDGEYVVVAADLLQAQPDGSLLIPHDRAELGFTLPVVAEQLQVGKREVETGRVVVHVTPHVRQETVDVPLAEETVEVERVEVNQFVQGPVAVRQEGDATVVPVLEEVLVVEKRLMLREEVRITRRRTTRHHVERVPLRTEEVHVLRSPTPST